MNEPQLTGVPAALPETLARLVGTFLARQRWAARGSEDLSDAAVQRAELLLDGTPPAWWVLARAGGALYQLLIGLRPADDPIDLGERDVLGTCAIDGRDWQAYDALADPVLGRRFAELIGVPPVGDAVVRPVGAEQSNSSVVIGERIILKLFRRLQEGPNPDVEVTTGLDRVGFNHLASPVAVWQRDGYDLAVAQEFLAGGAEGWALALTSLRDLLGGEADDPAGCGGDFASEARRVGVMTGRMHVALAEAFGTHRPDPAEWLRSVRERAAALGLGAGVRKAVDAAAARVGALGEAGDVGVAIRVHGDYHLGQVMRTDSGWFVLDFEGEPARPIPERRKPWPPAKDVSGMLRSFDYAAAAALAERDPSQVEELAGRARAWEHRNREAFLDGYASVEGLGPLVPGRDPRSPAATEVTSLFELDKALYEVAYERAHRPDWERIPLGAIERLIGG